MHFESAVREVIAEDFLASAFLHVQPVRYEAPLDALSTGSAIVVFPRRSPIPELISVVVAQLR
jgi:hypothetical protein